MYKKHGRDRESNLERQVKALVEKMLVEKGLSTMEPQTPMGPPGQLAVVGSPSDVPSSQGSNATGTPSIAYGRQPVANWWFRWAGKT